MSRPLHRTRCRPRLVLSIALAASTACDSGGLGPADRPGRVVALQPADGNGITGTATIIPEPGGYTSTITVELRGLAPGVGHVGHVHYGSCANPGEIDVTLSAVLGDADGRGSATTTGVPNHDLQAGYAVHYHVTIDPPGRAIACGDIGGPATAGGEAAGGPGY